MLTSDRETINTYYSDLHGFTIDGWYLNRMVYASGRGFCLNVTRSGKGRQRREGCGVARRRSLGRAGDFNNGQGRTMHENLLKLIANKHSTQD
jgi:hypothetical protein